MLQTVQGGKKKADGKYKFVAFDLEYSGIQRDLAPGMEKVNGRKQTIEERYQNVKVRDKIILFSSLSVI